MNESRRKELADFSQELHHRSNAFKRREEALKGKNILALEMVKRAMNVGVTADYLLVDSWYAKPDFIHQAVEMGLDIIARLPCNVKIWHFKGKYKTLQSLYDHSRKSRHKHTGHHGKIRYRYFDLIAEITCSAR